MMRIGYSAAVLGLLLGAGGCGGEDFAPDEASGPSAPSPSGSDGAGPGGGAMGAGGSGGGEAEGAGGGGVDGCDSEASPADASCVVDDAYGIFVRNEGDDAAAGTKDKPVRSLAKAIELASAQHKRVYACAQTFAEAVVVPGGVSVYGGLACDDYWSWQAGQLTRIEAPTAMAVRVAGGSGATRLADLRITASDASDPNGSSTALYVDGIDTELSRCELFAGNGAPGAPGSDAPSGAAAAGPNGNVGAPACWANTISAGGTAVSNGSCSSTSGAGGKGVAIYNGGSGSDGLPALGAGDGGAGQSSPSWTCYTGGGLAGTSAPGAQPGKMAAALGSLVEASGFRGGDGHAGSNGTPGQGGGGGGGSTGVCGNAGAGASGGSGGAGGCGGLAGQGGMAGGSSIALAIRSAAVTLSDVELFAMNGAAGGAGGEGQPGGAGGNGGAGGVAFNSTLGACAGGKGGKGGYGGAGSGGAGGHSAGIVYLGVAPTLLDVTFTLGAPGSGGSAPLPNGNGDGGGFAGPGGQSEEIIAL